MNNIYDTFLSYDLNMHYFNRYIKFINSIKDRKLPKDINTEIHHIIPRSLGGSDDRKNLINLKLREHFLIHYLLYKSLYNNVSMAYALFLMCNTRFEINKKYEFRSSKRYEELRNSIKDSCPARNLETGEVRRILRDDINNSPELFETLGKGMISVKNLLTGKFERHECDYVNHNKDIFQYMTFGYISVFDEEIDSYKLITIDEYYTNEKYKKLRMSSSKVVARIIGTNDFSFIPQDEYSKNKNIYETPNHNKIAAKNLKTGIVVKVELEEFYKNRDLYETSAEGKIAIKSGDEYIFIDSSNYDPKIHQTATSGKVHAFCKTLNVWGMVEIIDFNKNRENYISNNDGEIVVYNKMNNNYERTSLEKFYNNRESYITSNEGKTSVYEKSTGDLIRITSDEYAKNRHLYDHANSKEHSMIPVYKRKTGEQVIVSNEEYWRNKHEYIHASTVGKKKLTTEQIINYKK